MWQRKTDIMLAACGVVLGSCLAFVPAQVSAGEKIVTAAPAVYQTSANDQNAVQVQQVNWRNGIYRPGWHTARYYYGPGYYYGPRVVYGPGPYYRGYYGPAYAAPAPYAYPAPYNYGAGVGYYGW